MVTDEESSSDWLPVPMYIYIYNYDCVYLMLCLICIICMI